jgi:16S rRNA C967 or C1407 C5-methylase (RsmB/RsmF family)
MGRKWKRKNKNKHSGEGKPRDDGKKNNPDWGKERDPYTTISAGNFRMEAFYAYQGVHNTRLDEKSSDFVDCSTAEEKEAERQRWLTSMKSTLPIAFRIGNDVDPDLRKQLITELEEFVGKKIRIEVEPKGGKRRQIREQQFREMEGQKTDEVAAEEDEKKDELPLPELEKEVKWISPAEKLPFIPHAYHVSIDKQTLRRNSALKDFHDWIKIQTDAGFVTRQEAVSMIPPVVLDSKPHHIVLDMAAAPGSKTSQLLEIANLPTDKDCHEPKGCVVANDSDVKRAYMLVHQTRRINSPAIFITNCDARFFPLLKDKGDINSEGIFDRVLADVPCTGDGTARKNPGIWKNWSALNGYALHPLQLAIALRGAQATKVGGYLCYSTCSINPIENEAVVAELLRASEGALELVERKSELDGLVSRPGLTTWKNLAETKSSREIKNHKKKNNAKMVARRKEWEEKNKQAAGTESEPTVKAEESVDTDKAVEEPASEAPKYVDSKTEFKPKCMGDTEDLKKMVESTGMVEYMSHDEVPALMRKRIRPSCFPPTPEEIEKFNLQHCMRIMPQDMNTGGFFVALLKKVAPVNARVRKRFETLQKYADDAAEKKADDEKKSDADDGDSEPQTKKVKVDDATGEHDAKDVEMTNEKPESSQKADSNETEKKKVVGNDDFLPVTEDIFKPLKEFYGLDDESFETSNYMVRSGGDGKVLYFVTKTIRSLLIDRGIQDKVNTINSGVKCFTRNNKECVVNYRVSQEGVHFVAPHMKKRKITANLKDFEMCLSGPTIQCKDFSEEFASKVRELSMGSFVVTLEGYENDYIKKFIIVLWRCRSDCVNYLITQTEIDGIRSKLRAIAQK